MVIGKGLMAQTFKEYESIDSILIFASGVSNSRCQNKEEYEREAELLASSLENNPNIKFIYFSTCSINDPSLEQSPYVNHKLAMENYLKTHSSNYLIFRISNVVGPIGNSNTLLNFMVSAIKNDHEIEVWEDAERNLIDKDDVRKLVTSKIEQGHKNKTINIAFAENIKVIDILNIIEIFLRKKAKRTMTKRGAGFVIDTSDITGLLDEVVREKGSGSDYLNFLLKKYY